MGRDGRIDAYLDALEREMSRLETVRPIATLFLGGGTPSHLSPPQQERLFGILARRLSVEPGGEVTLEANPDDVTAEKASLWREHGVTRLSLGAQSFNAKLLHALERRHRVEHVAQAVERARRADLEVSLDLIFAVPGQEPADWLEDIKRGLALGPDHISTYGLTFEKGTRLWKQREGGAVQSLPEERELEMYLAGKDALQAAGFEHYEVSNFARPGRRSRHNQVYWANEAYFGFGMGAASYVDGVRRLNVRDLDSYIRRALEGKPTHFQEEKLPARERALETVATQLRRLDGVEREGFREQTGFDLDELISEPLSRLVDLGLLKDEGDRVRLTRRGLCVADGIIVELLAAR